MIDIKLKYRAFVGEKHADIAYNLINSDIETFAVKFGEWLLKNQSTTVKKCNCGKCNSNSSDNYYINNNE